MKDCRPLADGEYVVQSVFGSITTLHYTHEAGWNTSYKDGALSDKYAMEDRYVARWFKVPEPKEVPDEWLVEYMERR